MQSSQVLDDIEEIAQRLSPERVQAVTELRRGNNSRIFQVSTHAGRYALKRYPATDNRNRLEAEVRALRFFERKGVDRTPRLIAVDPVARFALLTWLEGEPVAQVSDRDVAEFADFQIALDRAVDSQAVAEIGEASEACLSAQRIVSHIERRYARLEEVKGDMPDFAAFFDGALIPALQAFKTAAGAAYRGLGLSFSEDIAPRFRTLIPSDLGAHNALRGKDGRIYFLDFEYFGWDDPITSIANFIMHPGMQLTERQKERYSGGLLGHFARNKEAERLSALMPLYALRWCAIILGELLPERWRHRLENNADLGGWDQARATQINKARLLISRFQF